MFLEEKPDYIIGDLHLGGDCGLFAKEYSRDFDSVEEYEAAIIANWNQVVTNDESIIFFLGDIGNKQGIETIIAQLRGRKFLILGNHDNFPISYYKQFFEGVSKTPVFIEPRIVLSHEPIPTEPGVWNFHGHTHSIYLDSDRHLNLCPEYNGYKPLLYKKLRHKLSEISKPSHKFLTEWYADKQRTDNKKDRDELVFIDGNLIDVEASKPLVLRKKYGRKLKHTHTPAEIDAVVKEILEQEKIDNS